MTCVLKFRATLNSIVAPEMPHTVNLPPSLHTQGFYPVGNQCSISSTGTVERVDFNGRPIESRRDITAKPVMSNDRIFCECYTSVSSRTAIEPPVVQCQHSVTLCPRSLPIM